MEVVLRIAIHHIPINHQAAVLQVVNNNKSTAGSNASSYNSSTKKSSTGTSSSKKSNTYDSYDDGYDDIYMDGDYADGADEAMDEFDEGW